MRAIGNLNGNGRKVWQFLLCLTLFAVLFRGAFPAGYMPHWSTHGAPLIVTLCTAHGADLVALADSQDDPSPSSDPDGAAHTCPFCAVVSQAIMPGVATLALAPVVLHEIARTRADSTELLPALITGPPLGSRAPPLHLG